MRGALFLFSSPVSESTIRRNEPGKHEWLQTQLREAASRSGKATAYGMPVAVFRILHSKLIDCACKIFAVNNRDLHAVSPNGGSFAI